MFGDINDSVENLFIRIMSCTQTQIPPSYPVQIVGPPPCYSCKLLCGEKLIQETRSLRGLARGTFKKQCGGITVVLTEQDDDAVIPTYGRRSSVNGAVAFDQREGITEVTVKLLGQMRLYVPAFNSSTVTLVDQQQTLWAPSSSICPGTLSFSFDLPSTFNDGNSLYPLPPSFNLAGHVGSSGLTAICKYTLEIKVISRGIGRWTKTKNRIEIPIEFMPRSRPVFPPVPEDQLFRCAFKTDPGEWHERLTTIPSRTLPPVNALIFIPSTRVFAYSERIPFYVQLSGPRCSLSDLSPTVSVSLLRQFVVTVGGERDWRSHTLAQGKMTPSCTRQNSLDWEGTIQVPKELGTPSFLAGRLDVKDFIVLSVIPDKSSFERHLSSVPIKIVTDSWAEEGPAS